MSEFTNNRKQRIDGLLKLFYLILNKNEAKKAIEENKKLIDSAKPSDIIILVDRLVLSDIPIIDIKTGINKFLNVLYKTIDKYPYKKPEKGSFLECCIKNNIELSKKLKSFQPLIKRINEKPDDKNLQNKIINDLKDILIFDKYYIIKENIIFPLLEKEWKEPNCIKVMWSFHDDIRKNLKKLISMLIGGNLRIKEFNKHIGALYFNINAIIFRDEKILFPFIEESLSVKLINSLYSESIELGFPYYNPEINLINTEEDKNDFQNIDLRSGELSIEQLILLFNHLPVDITFVDENNKVKFFSTPKKRIFPRTNSIIGRDVHNCHPPESVHIVEQIIEEFRKGSKDFSEFWLNIGDEKVLIKYFALRDKQNTYKGVIEVSQEISDIIKIKGEKKLLNWD